MTTYYGPATSGASVTRTVVSTRLSGVYDFPTTNRTSGKAVSGFVYDVNGNVVSGATVDLFRTVDDLKCQTTTSDISGHYSFVRDSSDTYQYWVLAYSVTGATPTVQIHGVSDRTNVPA